MALIFWSEKSRVKLDLCISPSITGAFQMVTQEDLREEEDEWIGSGARTFWMFVCFGLLALMLYNSKMALLWGGQHNPGTACFFGICFFILGIGISIADDGGLGEGLGE